MYNEDQLNKLNELIGAYTEKEKVFREADDNLSNFLKDIYEPKISEAKTLTDIEAIKESTRIIPQSPTKLLLFRSILVKENELQKDLYIKSEVD